MADSDIVVSGLVATPGLGHIALQYSTNDPHEDGLLNLSLDVVEVYASTTNDRGTDSDPLANLVAEGNKTTALHVAIVEGTTWFYWIRAKNQQGFKGDWYPASQTGGLKATVGSGSAGNSLVNGKIVASVAGNALTIAIKTLSGDDPSSTNPVTVPIRDSDGSYTTLALTAATSFVISSGSSLGTLANIPFRIWIVGFNDSGTFRLGVKNCSNGSTIIYPLAESGLASSTAEGGAGGADAVDTIYTAVAVTSKPFKIVGYVEWVSGLSTPGTWSSGPTATRLFGPGVPKPGDVVQDATSVALGSGGGTTLIPLDSSIPQGGEGVATGFGTQITPVSPINFVDFDLLFHRTYSVQSNIVGAMFRDSEPSAFASVVANCPFANAVFQLKFNHRRQMADSALRTYNFRVGGVSAGTIGAAITVGNLGGTLLDYYKVSEIMA